MKLGWASDIHLNHLTKETQVAEFIQSINDADIDHLLITGDLSDGLHIVPDLQKLDDNLEMPISLVLGNHDFWHSSFENVRKRVLGLTHNRPWLRYLPSEFIPVELTPDTALVGVDGWYDGRLGAPSRSFTLNDWDLIKEFSVLPRHIHNGLISREPNLGEVKNLSQVLALREVNNAYLKLNTAADAGYRRIIFATHVPPWEAVSRYMGQPSERFALPWFTCKAMGDMLEGFAEDHPDMGITVLCGHTHDRCSAEIRHNLVCHVAGAEYGKPRMERVFEL